MDLCSENLQTARCFDDIALTLLSNSSCMNLSYMSFFIPQKMCISRPYCFSGLKSKTIINERKSLKSDSVELSKGRLSRKGNELFQSWHFCTLLLGIGRKGKQNTAKLYNRQKQESGYVLLISYQVCINVSVSFKSII